MPRLPRLRISALEDLAKQLRFAPPETLRRQLERAEALATELDPAVNYPEDWLVFRVTGYRPQIDEPAVFVGAALLGDLSAFVERLSAAAKITEADLNGDGSLSLAELRARWSVSAKTLERYRRMGLLARRVTGPGGRTRLAFPRSAVERFEKTLPQRLETARAYTRIEPALRERILREAATYRRRFGWSRDRASRRLAKRFGRGHETVRQILLAADRASGAPTFAEPGPPTAKERRLIDLASWRGVEPGDLATRLGRSKASMQRVINEERAARLRSLLQGPGALPQPAKQRKSPGGRTNTPSVAANAFGREADTDLLTLVQNARQIAPTGAPPERALAERYHALVAGAAASIAALKPHEARATALDRVETDLRAAARLKAELVHAQLPLLVRTLETTLGRPLEELRGSLLLPLVQDSIAALASSVDDFDPAKGGRLAGPAGLALTRLATRFVREHGTEAGLVGTKARATARLAPGIVIEDWTRRIAPWQSRRGRVWLEPDPRVRVRLAALAPRAREVLSRRMGWGHEPGTLAEVAKAMKTTPMAIARIERAAFRRAMGATAGDRSR